MPDNDLKGDLERTRRELLDYKGKIKDVAKAYKSLETERNALHAVISAFEPTSAGTSSSQEPTLDALKNSFADFTRETGKREQAFINDKKALVQEAQRQKDRSQKLAEQLRDAQEQLEHAAKIVGKVKEQKTMIRQIEASRERELQDHGCVLAEIQKHYSEEKTKSEKLTKQVSEMYKKIQERDDMPAQFKSREKELKEKIKQLEEEIEVWKKKAAITPTVQLLQDQITNMKREHEHAIVEAVGHKIHATVNNSGEERLRELENRLMLLCEQSASEHQQLFDAKEEIRRLEKENANMKELLIQSSNTRVADPLENFKNALTRLEMERPDISVAELTGFDQVLKTEQKKCVEFERKLEQQLANSQTVENVKTVPEDNSVSIREDGMRSMIRQLTDKMHSLELSNSTDRLQYEETLRVLKDKITELESNEQMRLRDVRSEMSSRIAEMENEMQKQRTRTLELLSEKEHELEATRSILVNVRSEQLNTSAPADPPHKHALVKRKSSEVKAGRRSSGHRYRSTDSVSSAFEYQSECSQLPIGNESKNIYYEDVLAKKDGEIRELRNSLHQLDYKMRELEQGHLCKDLQQHEQIECLKEDIRILEGKLRLSRSDGQMEYLRNIYVQYLSCENSHGKRGILKAMGTCLNLSPNEMKAIDKKTN